jgi:hypothetical protein
MNNYRSPPQDREVDTTSSLLLLRIVRYECMQYNAMIERADGAEGISNFYPNNESHGVSKRRGGIFVNSFVLLYMKDSVGMY